MWILQGSFPKSVRTPVEKCDTHSFRSAVRELLVQFTLEVVTGFLGTDPGLGSSGGILILERDLELYLRNLRFILGYCCISHSGTATPTVHSALASHFHKFVIVDKSDIKERLLCLAQVIYMPFGIGLSSCVEN